jgi:hypothetical protein
MGQRSDMIWFDHPPISVIDWKKPGKIRQVSWVETAGEELLKWPKTKKRDKAASLLGRCDGRSGRYSADEESL